MVFPYKMIKIYSEIGISLKHLTRWELWYFISTSFCEWNNITTKVQKYNHLHQTQITCILLLHERVYSINKYVLQSYKPYTKSICDVIQQNESEL